MPAILTHDFFGRDVLASAGEALDFASLDEHDAFLLGAQGPDPVFYLEVTTLMRKWVGIADLMHDERPASLLLAMRSAVDRLPRSEQAIGRAYLAGFACHWLLDSTVHPLVISWQRALCSAGVDGLDARYEGIVHIEVERDLDEAVLFSKEGRTIEEWRPFEQTLHASRRVLSIIDKVYFYVTLWAYGRPVDPTVFSVGTRRYRSALRAIYSPRPLYREAVGAVERALSGRPYSVVCALSQRPRRSPRSDFDNVDHEGWEDPWTHEERRESFWDLYDSALGRAPELLASVLADGFDFEESGRVTEFRNFKGRVVDDLGMER